VSHDNNTTHPNANNTISELKGKKPGKKAGGKKDMDAVEEFGSGPADSPEMRSNEKMKKGATPASKKKVTDAVTRNRASVDKDSRSS